MNGVELVNYLVLEVLCATKEWIKQKKCNLTWSVWVATKLENKKVEARGKGEILGVIFRPIPF